MMKVGEISLVNPSKSEISERKDIQVYFLPMKDIKEYEKNVVPSKRNIIQNIYKVYTYFKENDLLIAKITPFFENGKMSIVKNLKNGICFGSTEYIIIRANTEITNVDWIYYCLRNSNFLTDNKEKIDLKLKKIWVANKDKLKDEPIFDKYLFDTMIF